VRTVVGHVYRQSLGVGKLGGMNEEPDNRKEEGKVERRQMNRR